MTALVIGLVAACGGQTTEAPEPPPATVVEAPALDAQISGSACEALGHIVLRRTAHKVASCRESARSGYPGATRQPVR